MLFIRFCVVNVGDDAWQRKSYSVSFLSLILSLSLICPCDDQLQERLLHSENNKIRYFFWDRFQENNTETDGSNTVTREHLNAD